MAITTVSVRSPESVVCSPDGPAISHYRHLGGEGVLSPFYRFFSWGSAWCFWPTGRLVIRLVGCLALCVNLCQVIFSASRVQLRRFRFCTCPGSGGGGPSPGFYLPLAWPSIKPTLKWNCQLKQWPKNSCILYFGYRILQAQVLPIISIHLIVFVWDLPSNAFEQLTDVDAALGQLFYFRKRLN